MVRAASFSKIKLFLLQYKPASSSYSQYLIFVSFSQFSLYHVCKWNTAYTCNWINMKLASNKKILAVRLQKSALGRNAKIAGQILALKYLRFSLKGLFSHLSEICDSLSHRKMSDMYLSKSYYNTMNSIYNIFIFI